MSKTDETQKINGEKSLELVKDPGLKKLLTNILDKVQHEDVCKEAEEVKKKIIKSPKQPEQTIFAFIPHEMAKVSIFFPMSDRELKEENRKISRIEQETGWGKIVIEGIKLAIFEEDMFLTLIKIAMGKTESSNGKYILKTNMKAIVNLLYGSSGYTKQSFKRVERALQHFQLVRFELTTYDWKKEGKERLKTRVVRSIGNIVQSYKYDEKTKDLVIYFNPQFFVYFLESMLTGINLTLRKKLKKDGSKAIMRFLATHTNPKRMHILTVLKAINYNIDQPMYALRRRFKQFITELKKNKILGPKTKIYSDDTIYFNILKSRKTLPD